MSNKKNNKNVPHIYVRNDPTVLRIVPGLASEIGLNESILLMQLEYLVSISNTEIKDGKHWTYQSIRGLQEEYFPFWSIATINRTINSLEENGYIIIGNYNSKKYDKTRWISINYDHVDKLNSVIVGGLFQNETRSAQNETRSAQNETTIPETPSETPSDLKDSEADASVVDRILNQPDVIDGLIKYEKQRQSNNEKLGIALEAINEYPVDVQHIIKCFSSRWKILPPPKASKDYSKWIGDAKEIKVKLHSTGLSAEEVFNEAYYVWKTPPEWLGTTREMYEGQHRVSDLGSVNKLIWESASAILDNRAKRKTKTYRLPDGTKKEVEI